MRFPLHLAVVAALAGCGGTRPACGVADQVLDPSQTTADLHVLSWNVGNPVKDGRYALRIRDQDYEDYVAAAIQALEPDVVALQEVLSPLACEGEPEPDSERTCFAARERRPAIRRLLGPNYSIVCDANQHVDCLGVHVRLAAIEGVPLGGLRINGAHTLPLPLPACDYLAGECDGSEPVCDAESTVSTVTLRTVRGPMQVISMHPTAIGNQCRQRQTAQAFAMAREIPTIVLGDWNFDPDLPENLGEAAIWSEHVGPTRRFRDHGARLADGRRARTSVGRPVAIDHVVTDFAAGACQVWCDPRLDDGHPPLPDPAYAVDHFAVDCHLRW